MSWDIWAPPPFGTTPGGGQDAARLLAELRRRSLQLVPDARVQLNDSVVLHEESEGEAEEFIVHAPGLIVKAPGFISAETALGSAVLGKQAGDVVRVETPRSRRTFVVQAVRRWSL